MRHLKSALALLTSVLLLGCSQPDDEFRLGFFWGTDEKSEALIKSTGIITFDELLKIDRESRLALMRRNEKLGIAPVKEVLDTATFEYSQIPPNQRTQQDDKQNFGFVWVKPQGAQKEAWTNIQLWIKTEAIAEGKQICHNINSGYPWTFYLSNGACDVGSFEICDDSTPKLGLIYSRQYDLVMLSDTASTTNLCE